VGEENGITYNASNAISGFPHLHIGEEVKVEEEGEAEEGAFEDEAVGGAELDEIVSGDGISGEGSDDDLDYHHDEEEDADGRLRHDYSRALVVDTLGTIFITYAFGGVHGEVHHGRD